MTEHLLSGNMLRFEEGLMDAIIEFGRELYQEVMENLEKTIRDSTFRKQNYYVEHKEDRRTLLTRFGNIEIKRAYYTPKSGGKGIYLLDKYVGIDANDKVSQAALASALREAVETSCRKGGEEACMTADIITKQTVKKLIHELEVGMPEDIPGQKKKIKNLHIQADEDHVALQFYQEKGDLRNVGTGRKSNTAMPKLILLYEGKEANEYLWLEVQQYIYDHYDMDFQQNVYIVGDGALWIVAGCGILEKSKFVLDKFHLWKYIQKATNHLLDSTEDVIYEAIARKDLRETERLFRKCAASAMTQGKIK